VGAKPTQLSLPECMGDRQKANTRSSHSWQCSTIIIYVKHTAGSNPRIPRRCIVALLSQSAPENVPRVFSDVNKNYVG
jgi:hypothetical protein